MANDNTISSSTNDPTTLGNLGRVAPNNTPNTPEETTAQNIGKDPNLEGIVFGDKEHESYHIHQYTTARDNPMYYEQYSDEVFIAPQTQAPYEAVVHDGRLFNYIPGPHLNVQQGTSRIPNPVPPGHGARVEQP